MNTGFTKGLSHRNVSNIDILIQRIMYLPSIIYHCSGYNDMTTGKSVA